MTDRDTETQDEWLAARLELLEREKEHSRMGDDLARQRRELPPATVAKEYTLQTEDGAKTLAELFDGRSQLMVYHFVFGPGYQDGCPTCSSTADSFNGVLPHLEARDMTMICVSRAPIERLLAYRERMGWGFIWASSHESDFNFDFGVSAAENLPRVSVTNASATGTDLDGYFSEGHGVSTFAREGGTVYHCYSSYARGTEFLMGYYAILDRAPKGRDEGGQPMSWLRRKDEYRSPARAAAPSRRSRT
jgi:predicted dithiol-disulfide oxidoreductase (DUF899 family)